MISPATIAAKWLLPPPESSTPQPAISATTSRDATTYPTRRPGEIDLENDPSRSTVGSIACSDGGASGTVSRYTSSSITVTPCDAATWSSCSARGAVEAAAGRVGERRHEVEQAVAARGRISWATAGEIVRVGPAGVAGEADDAQPVVAEDPQTRGSRSAARRTRRHPARRAATGSGRVAPELPAVISTSSASIGWSTALSCSATASRTAIAPAGSAVGQRLPALGGQHAPPSPRRRRRWPAPTGRGGPRSGRSRPRYGCTARRRRVPAPRSASAASRSAPAGLRNVHRAPSRKVPTAQLVCPTSGSRGVAGCGANVDARRARQLRSHHQEGEPVTWLTTRR